MTMRNIFTTILIYPLLGAALTLTACDKGADKGDKGDKTAQGDKQDKKVDEPKTDGDQPEAPTLDPKVEQAVTVANKISANPGEADEILADAGLDRDSFDKLLYEIARDPELSKSYAVARDS